MTLQQELDEQRERFAGSTAPGRVARIQRAIDELTGRLAERDFLQPGDRAPDFALPNALGEQVRLSDLLGRGPVILSFYRGSWCPYCSLELRAYQRRVPTIHAAGGQLVAVSPQTPANTFGTKTKNRLDFEVLSDQGSRVADAYRLTFELPTQLRALYQQLGTALPDFNGTDDWRLPIPATFVIDRDASIALAFAEIDYRRRLEPDDAIAALRGLSGAIA